MFSKSKISYADIKETITLQQLCHVLGIRVPWKFREYKNLEISKISLGRKYVPEGGVLFQLGRAELIEKGVAQAIENKALAVFCDKKTFKKTGLKRNAVPVILVPNAVERMGRYFDLYRNEYSGKIVGITGSIGKTTTRNFIENIVGEKNTYIDRYNYNSTNIVANNVRNKLLPEYKVFIQEAGAGGIDTIKMSSRIMTPDVAVITNVKPHHLNTYGSLERVFADKIMMAENVRPNGTVVVNYDDPLLAEYDYGERKVFSFGIETERDVVFRAVNVQQINQMLHMDIKHHGRTTHIEANIMGEHNAYNILAAFAVGKALKYKDQQLVNRIKTYKTRGIRQNLVAHGEYLLFMDCYNICNDSVMSSMSTMASCKLPEGARKIAIIGGENKLGDECESLTRQLAVDIKDIDVDEIVVFATPENDRESLDLYGDGKTLYDELRRQGKENVKLILSFDALSSYISENVRPGDMLLCKTIFHLNTFTAVDKCFGTSFSSDNRWVRENSIAFQDCGFEGRIVKDMGEAYITKIDSQKLNEAHLSIPSMVADVPVYMLKKGLCRWGKFESIDFGTTLKTIGERCFQRCENLRKIELPDSLFVVESGAFRGCIGLEEVHFGRGIKHIDVDAFKNCEKLRRVYLPSTVGRIEETAFPACAEIIYYGESESHK